MGTYTTFTSLLTVLPGLPQTTTSSPQYTDTSVIIGAHITRAENIVNSMIARRYSVPWTVGSVPPMVVTLTEDIATYLSYRSFYSQDNQNKTEHFTELKTIAFELLQKIVDSEIDLVDTAGSLVSERAASDYSSMVDSNTRSYQPFFDIDDSLDQDFDADLKDVVSGLR
jgi:hypothetical protein